MTSTELKEKILTELSQIYDRIQNSPAFIHSKDRYENLSPLSQKALIYGSSLFLIIFVFSIPWGFLSLSWEYLEEFEQKKNLTYELEKIKVDGALAPLIPPSPNSEAIKKRISDFIKDNNIPQELVKSNAIVSVSSPLFPDKFTDGAVQLEIQKLNLKQIVDITHAASSLGATVKLKDLIIRSNSQDPKYLDLKVSFFALSLPQGSRQ